MWQFSVWSRPNVSVSTIKTARFKGINGVFVGCLICIVLSLSIVIRSTPQGSITQSNRLDEIRAVTLEARPGGGGILVKAAGSGQEDAQCCEVDGLMPAPIIDDVGLYVVAATMGRILDSEFKEIHLFRLLLGAWVLGIVAVSLFISRRYGRKPSVVVASVLLLALIYRRIFDELLFVSYGTRTGGDLFYGLQSALSFLGLGLALLTAESALLRNSGRPKILMYTFAIVVISSTELVRSGAILWMPLIFVWATHQIPKRRLWLYVCVTSVVAWLGSKLMLLAIGLVRYTQTGIEVGLSTLSHPIWHTLYLGLAYTRDGSLNDFGVQWSDNWLYSQVAQSNPNVVLHSAEYTVQVRDWFIQAVTQNPWLWLEVTWWKLIGAIETSWQELLIGVSLVAIFILLKRRPPHRSKLVMLALVGSISPLIIAWPLPTYLGFALPLFHTLSIVGLFSVTSELKSQRSRRLLALRSVE